MKLLCFPYAGGTANFYKTLEDRLKPFGIEVISMEYSGHGRRTKEPLYAHFEDLVNEALEFIDEMVNQSESYGLLGYSMGSIVLSEVIRKIEINNFTKKPIIAFVLAHGPKIKEEIDWESASDDTIKQHIIEFDGVSNKLLNNVVYWRIYTPIYRNDFRILSEIETEKDAFISYIPTVFLYSADDDLCSNIQEWKKYFIGKTEYIVLSGGHFFINNNYDAVTDIIIDRLLSVRCECEI